MRHRRSCAAFFFSLLPHARTHADMAPLPPPPPKAGHGTPPSASSSARR
jgi:hypothetical protein